MVKLLFFQFNPQKMNKSSKMDSKKVPFKIQHVLQKISYHTATLKDRFQSYGSWNTGTKTKK